jgi:hypothetical protein
MASGASQAVADYGPSVASAIGAGAHVMASAAGQALSHGAHMAMQAPTFASHAARTAHYVAVHAGMTFEDLMHLVEHAPRAPMIENPKKRRSSTPERPMLKDAEAPEGAPSRAGPAHDTELLHFATAEEWASKPKGALVDQLYKRKGFAEALGIRHSKRNLATIFKRLASRTTKLMWTTTTPVPNVPTSYNRTYEAPVAYNKQALISLTAANGGVKPLVNDLCVP